MHMDDLRELAPLWLSKTEEVRADKEHWATNITGDIYASGWISEMYGYSFGAAEVGLRHQIRNDLMIYPGYIPQEGVHPLLMHYGLKFSVGSWSFSKADHHDDDIVYKCNKLFPAPPYPKEVLAMEPDPNRRRGLFLSIECMNSLNEGLLETHRTHGCPKPSQTRYIRFLKIWRRSRKTFSEFNTMNSNGNMINDNGRRSIGVSVNNTLSKNNSPSGFTVESRKFPKIHTLFSTECSTYFDWQTVGLIHSFAESGQPGSITRLLSCSDEQLKTYKGMDLAPTHVVPSYSLHPLTNDWYPAINKPASVLHWINHVPTDAEFLVILDADMVLRRPITPWEFGAEKGRPVSVPYLYLIGCDNELAKLHTRFPEACEKVGGIIIMHIDDLRSFAPLWLHKTEEVRADKDHWAVNFTGDIYGQGWISEMYGYSFGAAELRLRHIIRNDIMLYPGYPPPKEMEPHVLHYGLEFSVGNWSFDKAKWRDEDMTNVCWKFFPDPPNPAFLNVENLDELRRDTISIECVRTLNEALYLHHKRRGCHPSVNEDVVMVLNTANTEGIDSTGMIQNSRNTKLGDSMINDEADANYTSKRINEGENGSEEENGEVDNDWDSRGFQREKPHDWQYLGTDSNFKTANRKFSDLTGNIAELRISPKHSTTPLWSVSVLLFVLLTLYVYSSRCWLTSKKTKSKPRRLGLNASLIGKAHRTASTAE
ncbi:hypothetical protein KP509_14G014900 [Ceratopteris richardii]|nr:hypothetical protein KP509_14G014900 [Ceratopteris richardii]